MKSKKKWWKLLVLSIGILVALIALLYFYTNLLTPQWWENNRALREAEKKISEGYAEDAMTALDNQMWRNSPSSLIALKYIDLAMEYGHENEAIGDIITYLYAQEKYGLTDVDCDKLEFYKAQFERMRNTEDKIMELLAGRSELTYNEAKDIIAKLEPLFSDSAYDPSMLYFYMGMLTRDPDQEIKLYKEAYHLDPNYLNAACLAAERLWKEDKLQEARELLESAYQREKGDTEVLRDLAIIELLEENADRGLEFAEELHRRYEQDKCCYGIDVYYIAMMEAGKTEKSMESIAVTSPETPLCLDIEGYITGKVTLKELFSFDLYPALSRYQTTAPQE